MNKELEKYIIPDLSNIVMDYISGTKDYWRTKMNESIEQFKTRRLSIYMDGLIYDDTKTPVEMILFLRNCSDDDRYNEVDELDDNKFYYCVGMYNIPIYYTGINYIKRFYLWNHTESDDDD